MSSKKSSFEEANPMHVTSDDVYRSISKRSSEQIQRMSNMNIFYPCNGLGERNNSNDKKHLTHSYDGKINIPRPLGATIICEITLPDVLNYKITENRAIPVYSRNNMTNISSSKFNMRKC